MQRYCSGEVVKDTNEFLQHLELQNRLLTPYSIQFAKNKLLASLDVNALYPNIKRTYLKEALLDALSKCSNYTASEIDGIIQLVDICLSNSVVHYRNEWYTSKDGVPTGGTESVNLANIYVKWGLDSKILTHPMVSDLNFSQNRKRFLDDIFTDWTNDMKSFEMFLRTINIVGEEYGLTFTGKCGAQVEFLDVQVEIRDNKYHTELYIKPTDSTRYLNRRSHHSRHTFKAIPFSQFRRAVIICSETTTRMGAIDYMFRKFEASGYRTCELVAARMRALSLDRDTLLGLDGEISSSRRVSDDQTLIFVIQQNPAVKYAIKKILIDKSEDIKRITGTDQVIVSERGNPTTALLLQ